MFSRVSEVSFENGFDIQIKYHFTVRNREYIFLFEYSKYLKLRNQNSWESGVGMDVNAGYKNKNETQEHSEMF